MVLISIVLFANCSSWAMQAAIGTSYAILNVTYWFITVITEAVSWDLRAYDVREIETISNGSFTSALSHAIKATQSTAWVRENNVAPKSDVWRLWLDKIENHLHDGAWDAEQALSECFGEKGL